ncbi:hypothetical protein Tco_0069250, partial [Tanacetum coccineum]
PTIPIPDSIPEGSGGNHGDQAKEITHLKAQIKKLKKKSKPVITHHKAWIKSVSMKQRLAGKKSLKTKWMQKESVSKQGRKPAKAEPTGRTSSVVLEEKEGTDKEVSTEALVSIVKPNEGADKRNEGTDKQDGGTDGTKVSTDRQGEGTADQNKGKILITMSQNKKKEKEKGVEIRNVEDTERPRPTLTRSVLTLKSLPKIDPKDKGKKMIDEEGEFDTESNDITGMRLITHTFHH